MFQCIVTLTIFILITAVFYGYDPGYFIGNQIWYHFKGKLLAQESLVTRLIFQILRQSIVYFGLVLPANLHTFFIVLDMCRIEMYDFCMTYLLSKHVKMIQANLWIVSHKNYISIYLCHCILTEYFQLFYSSYMTFCQVGMVGYLWMSITYFGRVPWFLWTAFVVCALQVGCIALFYVGMSCSTHQLSHKFLEKCSKWRQQNMSRYQKLVWKSTRPLQIKFGRIFEINGETLFYSFQFAMNNLASLCLLRLSRLIHLG